MGPFPHDAPAATISELNPMGTDGIEFVEYAHPEPEKLGKLFETMGFTLVAKHRSKKVQLWRQGDVNFVVKWRVWGHSLVCQPQPNMPSQ